MAFAKLLLVVVVMACIVCQCQGQINFSPTWGTGKRSQPFPQFPPRSCMARSDMRILFNLIKIIQRESELIASCLNEEDDVVKQR